MQSGTFQITIHSNGLVETKDSKGNTITYDPKDISFGSTVYEIMMEHQKTVESFETIETNK